MRYVIQRVELVARLLTLYGLKCLLLRLLLDLQLLLALTDHAEQNIPLGLNRRY